MGYYRCMDIDEQLVTDKWIVCVCVCERERERERHTHTHTHTHTDRQRKRGIERWGERDEWAVTDR